MVCYRYIELTKTTWRTYVNNDDPERPTENTVFRKMRLDGYMDIDRWYRLCYHYDLADLYSTYKYFDTIYFRLGEEWQNKL